VTLLAARKLAGECSQSRRHFFQLLQFPAVIPFAFTQPGFKSVLQYLFRLVQIRAGRTGSARRRAKEKPPEGGLSMR
jgi:hypothetical protein